MFRRVANLVEVLALVAAVVFVVLLFANEPGSGGAGRVASPGAALFADHCARCHGSDGGGGIGPRLAGGAVSRNLTEAAEIALVTDGVRGMPGFAGDLSKAEIEQVVAYTRSL